MALSKWSGIHITSLLISALVVGLIWNPGSARAFGSEADESVLAWWVNNSGGGWTFSGTCRRESPFFCDPATYGEVDGNGINAQQMIFDGTIPFQVTDELVVGLGMGGGTAEFDWRRFQTDIDGEILFGGGYFAYEPTDSTMFAVSYTFGRIDSDFAILGSTGSYDTDLHSWSGELSHRFNLGHFWAKPTAEVYHTRANREAFRDTLFNELTPASKIKMTRVLGGVEFGAPLHLGPGCSVKDTSCQSATVYAELAAFYDDIDGINQEEAAALVDQNYVGIIGTLGAHMYVTDNLLIGGMGTLFQAGDLDGFTVRGYAKIRPFEFFRK